jgi:hypothetical protein
MAQIPTDDECMKQLKAQNQAATEVLIHELTKKIFPVVDVVISAAAVVVWGWTRNFTWGALIWLFGETLRIQINQKKIIDLLKGGSK